MSSRPGSAHHELLISAKQQQNAHLQDSASASVQLIRAVEALVNVHSATGLETRAVLLDKIATIHELDSEIDRQLNCDLVYAYEALMEAKQKLARYVQRTQRALAITSDSSGSYVDILQRRVELIDQELRILETTSALVDAHAQST